MEKAEEVTRSAIEYLEGQGFRLYDAPGFDDSGKPSAQNRVQYKKLNVLYAILL